MSSSNTKFTISLILTIIVILFGLAFYSRVDPVSASSNNPIGNGNILLTKESYLTIEEQTVQPRLSLALDEIKFIDKFLNDPLANTIAVITLLLMIASAVGVFMVFIREGSSWVDRLPDWLVPALSVIGMGIAIYLSFIEVSKTEPLCGPVGDCGAVQQSKYAYLFGVIPIGILGMVGYFSILVLWVLSKFGPISMQKWASLLIWIFAWFGLFFSIYLTFLEPFVIGATCAWCISSALVMTSLLWAATPKAKAFWAIEEDE
jgi:uncharacterized membrane protein